MKKHTIRHTLFLNFSVIVLISFLAIAAVFFFVEMPKQKEQTVSALEQNCAAIAQSADQEMEQIQAVAMKIAHSASVREAADPQWDVLTVADLNTIQSLMSDIIMPNDKSDQVNLYLPVGQMVGTGRFDSIHTATAAAQNWYLTVAEDPYHNAFVYMGENDQMGKFSTGYYSKRFISYVIAYYNSLNIPYGYIEVSRSVESVFHSAIHYNSVYGEEVYVIDSRGNLVYPENADDTVTLEERPTQPGFAVKDGRYVFYQPSAYSDFYTVLVISTWDLMGPVFDYMGKIALVAVLMLVLALAISVGAARRVSQPIRQMCDEVTAFDLTAPAPAGALQTKVAELNTLYDAFSDMRGKLIDSMNAQLLLQNQEMQSRMLALQAQMNPHFLYNSLATIQAMADENMNEEITRMCLSMSDILRYISSDAEQEVPLREEIRHVNNYLSCMAIRYQGDLTYDIRIPADMEGVKVPKLCIQLLVENAIKFSATGRPPYHITITGQKDAFHHTISVRDMGPGFTPEALATLNEKMAEIDASGLLPSLEINGMGLLNIYIRYKLLHKGKVIFRLENAQTQGACVTIGEYYGE